MRPPALATPATITLRATPAPNGTRSLDTATAEATQPTAPPVVAETAPAEELRRFDSQLHPYGILYPRQWSARGDAFRSGDVRGDLFSAPAREDVSLNILSEPLRGEALDTEGYARLTARAIQEATGKEPRRGRGATVAGTDAAVLEWEDRSRPLQVREVTQAVWVAGDRGWVATLSTPQGRRARYVPVFLRMLETMQLR